MRNGKEVKNPFERVYKLQTQVGRLVMEKKRDPSKVAEVLQWILSGTGPATFTMDHEFEEFFNFGVIRVPFDYYPSTWLKGFRRAHGPELASMADEINDGRHGDPNYIMTPGECLRVRVFRQVAQDDTSYEERMQFLNWQDAVFPGAHGIALVLEKIILDGALPTLPENYSYTSYDLKVHLPKWRGKRQLPCVVNLNNKLQFTESELERGRGPSSAFFCFTKA